MQNETVSGLLLTLLLLSMLTLACNVRPVRASGTIYIRPDGTVEGTDKIQRDRDIYTFTDNIYDEIVVERNNTVIDGSDYTLQGTGSGKGIWLMWRRNVTIRYLNIRGFPYGIWLDSSSNNTISGNNITNNDVGIMFSFSCSNNAVSSNKIAANSYEGVKLLYSSNNNTISGNNITANNHGIWLDSSSNNTISGNNIANNWGGIYLLEGYREPCSNNAISSNNITENDAGISYHSGHNSTISDNNITNNGYGIYLDSAFNNSIYENNIANNEVGIDLRWSSNNNNLYRNNITANSEQGIMIYASSNNTLRDNSVTDSMYNFGVWGPRHPTLVNDVDSSNTVDNKQIIYWINKQDMAVPIDAGYVTLIECKNITVQNLNLTNNLLGALLLDTTNSIVARNNVTANKWRGIEVIGSSNNSISGNNIANNDEGIMLSHSSSYNSMSENNVTSNKLGISLRHSSNNTIYRNDLANNDNGILLSSSSNNSISENDVRTNNLDGIRLSNSSNNIIFRNTVAYNLYGIYFLTPSSGNVIYHNNFINNTNQASKPSFVNAWDNGTEGNYWSDYEDSHPNAKELNGSGIWDTPYGIDDNNQDNYPLMSPWSPETPTEVPFWMQWWFWAIITAGIAVSVGAAYFLKKRKPPTPTAPSLPSQGTDAHVTIKQSNFLPNRH